MVEPKHIELEVTDVHFSEEPGGRRTIEIGGGQAMQSWERELMEESAALLCAQGDQFLEVGLGFGYSALTISATPGVVSHLVLEKRRKIIDRFRDEHSELQSNLQIEHGDVFDVLPKLGTGRFDGIFFDPSLPMDVWNDRNLWAQFTPQLKATLKPGGKLVPFFTTRPALREQFAPFFKRVDVYRREYIAFEGTKYTPSQSGNAYIQVYYD